MLDANMLQVYFIQAWVRPWGLGKMLGPVESLLEVHCLRSYVKRLGERFVLCVKMGELKDE